MLNKKKLDNNYFVLNIGDIHFSNNNAERIYNELKSSLLDFIEDNGDSIDMVVVTGDLFDAELKASSNASRFAFSFVRLLNEKCHEFNIALRLVKGTATHDCGQMETLSVLFDDTGLCRVITQVETEEVFPGFKALYIPEEYPKDMKAYYADTVFGVADGTYDFVFFHGTMEFQAFSNQTIESERPIESAPVWKCADMMRICRGVVTGGHIHTPCNYKEKIFYHGSFSREAHGEKDSKGFNVYDYLQGSDFKLIRVENDLAPVFSEIYMDELIIESGGNAELLLKILESAIESPNIRYRVSMNRELKRENPVIYKTITEFLSGKRNVIIKESIERRTKPVDGSSSLESANDKTVELEDRLKFLSDKSLSPTCKIAKYASEVLGYQMTEEDVQMTVAEEKL